MGVEAVRPSSSRPVLAVASGLFTRARLFASPGRLDASARNSPGTATFRAHWNPSTILRWRLPIGCGMHLAFMSCREALHARVESFCEEAA